MDLGSLGLHVYRNTFLNLDQSRCKDTHKKKTQSFKLTSIFNNWKGLTGVRKDEDDFLCVCVCVYICKKYTVLIWSSTSFSFLLNMRFLNETHLLNSAYIYYPLVLKYSKSSYTMIFSPASPIYCGVSCGWWSMKISASVRLPWNRNVEMSERYSPPPPHTTGTLKWVRPPPPKKKTLSENENEGTLFIILFHSQIESCDKGIISNWIQETFYYYFYVYSMSVSCVDVDVCMWCCWAVQMFVEAGRTMVSAFDSHLFCTYFIADKVVIA